MQKGQSLIELLLTIALVSILFPALLTGFISTRNNRAVRDQRQLATAYLNEGQEAIRVVRVNGWSNLSTGTYHPIVSGSTWILMSGSELIDSNFTRQIVIEDVNRDNNGNIAQDGTLDPSTKLITISVSWGSPFPNSINAKSYLTRHDGNTHTDTTVVDFSGIKNGTAVVATSGTNVPGDGQVQLATAGGGHGGDWCAPNLGLPSLLFPQKTSTNAIYAIPGQAFVGIGDPENKGFGESFANVTIAQNYPPTATTKYVYSSNPVYGTFGEESYAYLAVDDTSKQILILDTTHIPFTTIGSFTPPTTTRASSVYVSGNTGYMTAGNNLYNFDLTSKSGVRPVKDPDGVLLAGTGIKVAVIGNYAYVANSTTTSQLQVVDISNPTNLRVVGQTTVNNQVATDLTVNQSGTRVYLVTQFASGQKAFFIIDTTTKIGDQPIIGSFDTQGMSPHGVAIASVNRVIVVGLGGQQYEVLNISQETSPSRCGGLNIASGIYGIATILQPNGDAYSYIITGDISGQFKLILGGNGNQFASTGSFVSSTFDAASSSAFNNFAANVAQPFQTTIQMQVAVSLPFNNSCNGLTFNYVGPDLTSSTFFTPVVSSISGTISFQASGSYQNPGRCFSYKTYFNTSDTTQSPVLYDMTVNYSP